MLPLHLWHLIAESGVHGKDLSALACVNKELETVAKQIHKQRRDHVLKQITKIREQVDASNCNLLQLHNQLIRLIQDAPPEINDLTHLILTSFDQHKEFMANQVTVALLKRTPHHCVNIFSYFPNNMFMGFALYEMLMQCPHFCHHTQLVERMLVSIAVNVARMVLDNVAVWELAAIQLIDLLYSAPTKLHEHGFGLLSDEAYNDIVFWLTYAHVECECQGLIKYAMDQKRLVDVVTKLWDMCDRGTRLPLSNYTVGFM